MKLFPLKQKVEECGFFETQFSFLISAPTGSGKTHLSFELADKIIKSGKKVLYLTPLRAQGEELMDKWGSKFPNLKLFLGGNRWGVDYEKSDIIIATWESIALRIANWSRNLNWISSLGLVVIDEVHLIESPHRGALLEHLITWIKRVNPFCRLLALSATITRDKPLIHFLEAAWIEDKYRPIPLKIKASIFSPGKKSLLLESLIHSEKTTLVFVHGRKRAETLSCEFNKKSFKSTFHHAGLSKEQREQIERGVKNGEFNLIFATPTLEMGINLPVATVIIYDLYYQKPKGWSFISKRSLFQRVGRAGRPGLDESGEGIVMISQRDKKARSLFTPGFLPVKSMLGEETNITNFILREIVFNYSSNSQQLERAWQTTLGKNYSQTPDFKTILDNLKIHEFLYIKKNGNYGAEKITSLAVRSFEDPFWLAKCSKISENSLTPFDYILMGALSPNTTKLPFYYEEIRITGQLLQKTNSVLIPLIIENSDTKLFLNKKDLLDALRVALVIYHCGGKTPDQSKLSQWEITKNQIINSSLKISLFIKTLNRFLIFSRDKSSLTNDLFRKRSLILQTTLGILEGIPEKSAKLMILGGIGIKRVSILNKNRIDTFSKLSKTPLKELILMGIPKKTAITAKKEAQNWISFDIEVSNPPLIVNFQSIENITDPYRIKRAMDLTVTKEPHKSWLVFGGANPHIVKDKKCDCMDFRAGNHCKHIIAVELKEGNISINNENLQKSKSINIFNWWFSEE
jgi:ATP-dependent DNA helicase